MTIVTSPENVIRATMTDFVLTPASRAQQAAIPRHIVL